MESDKPKPPHPGDLIKVIRKLLARGAYSHSAHVLDERMIERGFDFDDIAKIIELGDIDGKIVPGRREGEWRCRVVGKLAWHPREAGVVTVVIREKRLLFVTVKWIDP
jgi:hypothetical protein